MLQEGNLIGAEGHISYVSNDLSASVNDGACPFDSCINWIETGKINIIGLSAIDSPEHPPVNSNSQFATLNITVDPNISAEETHLRFNLGGNSTLTAMNNATPDMKNGQPFTINIVRNDNCGNGAIDAGEQCDGDLFAPGEMSSCPADRPNGSVTCNTSCLIEDSCEATPEVPEEPVVPVCGNGTIETGEVCDDGNNVDGDGCSAICTEELRPAAPTCGNGTVETGEACDNGTENGDGMACNSNCATLDFIDITSGDGKTTYNVGEATRFNTFAHYSDSSTFNITSYSSTINTRYSSLNPAVVGRINNRAASGVAQQPGSATIRARYVTGDSIAASFTDILRLRVVASAPTPTPEPPAVEEPVVVEEVAEEVHPAPDCSEFENRVDSDHMNIGTEIGLTGDGLSDYTECLIGTNVYDVDTDGDSCWDGDEMNLYGTSPLDGTDCNPNKEMIYITDPKTEWTISKDKMDIYGITPLTSGDVTITAKQAEHDELEDIIKKTEKLEQSILNIKEGQDEWIKYYKPSGSDGGVC